MRSFECFLGSAMDGVPTAMYMTGYYYLNGIGVDPDISEARKWLKMASDNDVAEATELLSEIPEEE